MQESGALELQPIVREKALGVKRVAARSLTRRQDAVGGGPSGGGWGGAGRGPVLRRRRAYCFHGGEDSRAATAPQP